MKEIIKLTNVGLSYKLKNKVNGKKHHNPIKDIGFTLYEGETLGVLGKNGTGKSSLLKLLSGVLKPNKGKIEFRKGISIRMLSLQLGFDQNLSGYDNILLSSMLSGFSLRETKSMIQDIIEYSELGDFIYQPVKSYSSGMKSKLGFSISVNISPDVLLIDEALSVGDLAFKKKAEATIVEKVTGDQTVVFVSHSLAQVKRLCDRVLWMDDGIIRMIGTPEEVIPEYEKHFGK
ncbi:ABC transporter [Photobacterium proteolyticum]|uniref:ABC transporter n=1 Tax=Photobacterium proteolyticum TaxID=1903952 RepID=A0A1Q9GN58_9GAMM|nr:ATP-binding cassette domain-containing protein [Photobacterium proteolyticum]OLQ76085.1 ABC transporter [Photobacterium proteolyticum]